MRGRRLQRVGPVDDRLDVGLERIDIRPRSPSLAPVSTTSTGHRLLEQPVDPAERARRGLAAHAGVDASKGSPAESIFCWISAG